MESKKAITEQIHDFLASVRLSLFLFGALAATSIVGTLIPQAATTEQRLQQYGPKLNAIIELLDLADMYHSWWFQLLLILLAINLIICSLRRLPKTLKSLQATRKFIGPARVKKLHTNAQARVPLTVTETQALLDPILDRRFSASLWKEENGTWQAAADKGRIGRLGVYFVHIGVLLVLAGALIGSIFGFKGFVTIHENTSESHVVLKQGASQPLGFEIRCDKFTVEFYETGAPKEFRSDVSILEQGKVIKQAAIRVNDPVTHNGMTFYQSTYGSDGPSGIVLEIKDVNTSESKKLQVPFRETLFIPGTKDRLVVMDFKDNVNNFGPGFFIGMALENKEPAGAWILANKPEFRGNRIGDIGITVVDFQNRFYTGLQVKKDPGVWVIYVGFCLMLLAMIIALYISHRRVWLVLSPASNGTRVLVAGNASKRPLAFEREFQQLVQEINQLNQGGKSHD